MKEVLACPLLGLPQLCPTCAARIILGVANGKYLTLNLFCFLWALRTENIKHYLTPFCCSAETTVPWASLWLRFFELWLVTNTWEGSGAPYAG